MLFDGRESQSESPTKKIIYLPLFPKTKILCDPTHKYSVLSSHKLRLRITFLFRLVWTNVNLINEHVIGFVRVGEKDWTFSSREQNKFTDVNRSFFGKRKMQRMSVLITINY